ncbi:MAG: uncharacterized protein KVP18_003002 [Porospora cf. gigantea A]|nr:MAG: hypothetical protein KVP18_003002 [Porospora cf. gigantea A]
MGVSQAQLVPRKQLDDLLNDVVFTIGTSALKRELRQSRELYVKDRDSFVLKVESAELASGIESLREGVLFELERLGQVVGRVRHVTANESYLWSGKRVEESLFGVSDSIAAAFANFKGNQESEVMALNERLVDLREQVTQRKRRVLAQLEFLERIDIEAGDQVSLQRALDGARRCRVAAPYVAEGKKESRSVV